MSDSVEHIKRVIEGAMLAAGTALDNNQLLSLFGPESHPTNKQLKSALTSLSEDCAERGIELVSVATGHRLQIKQEYTQWVSRLWEEKPQRYSRALLETLAIIAYRQPVTRSEIEMVRGVAVSSQIIRTLREREWVRVIGHRDVPGKPALLATTRAFLDYFGLKSLEDLPTLAEIKEIGELEPELDFDQTA